MLLNDLELAFEFVSSAPPLSHTAYVSRATGETFYRSELGDLDELPRDVDDSDDYLEVPHRNDLDLGQRLVWEFVEREIPEHHDRVRSFFRRPGPYGRFKDFLDQHRMLETWHAFEDARTRQALLDWAATVGLTIDDLPTQAQPADLRVWHDELFTVSHSAECVVPGYVVVRLAGSAESLAELDPGRAGALGKVLSRTASAIERATDADRVYCLSFCEVDRRLHFHLFPRTRALLEAFRDASGAGPGPADGPALFQWARAALPPGTPPFPGMPSVEDVCTRLRALLAAG
jgi:diadenosine tetraphosphate (Ap4A) HIT family hydrolase